MKKKKWLIPLGAFGVILVFFVGYVGLFVSKGYGISIGRYLEAKNEYPMLLLDNSPIQMSNRTGKDWFNKLDVGDAILVIHDGIAETYPGKTGVYGIFKLGDGTAGDIPEKVVNQLIELGWLEKEALSHGNDTLSNPAPTYIVMEVTDNNMLVAAIDEDGKAIETKQYSVPNWFHPSTKINIGYKIIISHSDRILETFPMRFAEIYTMEYYDKEKGLSVVVIPD